MSKDPHQELTDIKPKKDFFIGIDSDGCAFDTMEIKHKECFCPNTIKYFDLQKVSKYAREAWDFVNLYSTTRGCNRFIALIKVLDLLRERREVKARKAQIIEIPQIIEWTKKETKLGNPTLEKYADVVQNDIVYRTLAWSEAINEDIEDMVSGIPPFPYVQESLEKMKPTADIMVVSQTPGAALTREWEEHDIKKFTRLIAGQEYGTKTEHLKFGAVGKYDAKKILMIGDAIGDLSAATANGVLFFPVNPGKEDESWQRFHSEALDKFFAGTYSGAYEASLIKEFKTFLPENPSW